MEVSVERLEEDSVLLLLAEDIPINPVASENLLNAIDLGLLALGSTEQERKYIDQSAKAGRTVITFMGAVA